MRRKLTIMLVIAAVLALIVATAASSMLPTYEETVEAELNKYEKLNKSELLDAMKVEFAEAARQGSIDSLIPISYAFKQKRDEYTVEELLELIESNSIDTFLRVTIVQVLNDKSGFDGTDSRLSELIKKDLPNEVKKSLLTHFGHKGGISENDLITLSNNSDEAVAFQAIKRLSQVSPQKAYTISKGILQNYRNANVGQIQSAVNVFASDYVPLGSTLKTKAADKELMYTVVEAVLNGNNYPQTTKDSVVFALADMRTIEEMEYILHHSKIDDIMKKTTVDRNYNTLIEMLESNPTAEQIEFAIECMELRPINEVALPLGNAIASKRQLVYANSTITQNRISSVFAKIENQGEPANPAWNQ
ncbi:MAG: hypothetical protein IJN37_07185 [Clostridia bacterium]|nr:hypothetical protein [Clostridia bacterium]